MRTEARLIYDTHLAQRKLGQRGVENIWSLADEIKNSSSSTTKEEVNDEDDEEEEDHDDDDDDAAHPEKERNNSSFHQALMCVPELKFARHCFLGGQRWTHH